MNPRFITITYALNADTEINEDTIVESSKLHHSTITRIKAGLATLRYSPQFLKSSLLKHCIVYLCYTNLTHLQFYKKSHPNKNCSV